LKLFGVIVNRRSAIKPYAAIVGTPPAEMREKNATGLARMVHKRTEAKI